MEWISVKDRLPEPHKCVKAKPFISDEVFAYFTGLKLSNDEPIFGFWEKSLSENGGFIVTHWLEISQPPKE